MGTNNWIDITSQWHAAHAHLVPFDDIIIGRDALTLETCRLCGEGRTIELSINVLSLQGDWTQSRDGRFCYGCRRFALVDPTSRYSFKNLPVSIDARLWSRSPTVLNLEPTTRCNFNCWYCVGRRMVQRDLSVQDFLSILENFQSLRMLALVGEGEPLLHPDFFAMVNAAGERGVKTVLTSNGSTLSRSVVQKLCESRVTYVSFSLDGATNADFSRSRVGGDLDQVLTGISRLREYRDAQGYYYPRLGLKGTLTSETVGKIHEIVELAIRHGIEIFEGFQTLNPMPTYSKHYPDSERSELLQIGKVAREMNNSIPPAIENMKSIHEFLEEEGLPTERYGRTSVGTCCDEQWLFASSSGGVMPCCQTKSRVNSNWNLKKSSVEQIENDSAYENMRFNLFNGIFMTTCSGCTRVGENGRIASNGYEVQPDT